jgi:hypothetical protein
MGLKRYLKNLLRHDSNTRRLINEQRLELYNTKRELTKNLATKEVLRTQYLQDKVLNTNESGVSNTALCDNEIIVSLTTYGIRIHDVYLAIESIMQGSVKPNRIVLWLNEDEFKGKDLPVTLQNQVARGLEIGYCKDIRSFTKLIPTLKKYPESCVITIDDDIIYDFDLVERLVSTHKLNKGKVCANRIHQMKLTTNNMPMSYMDWNWCVNDYSINKLNFLTGVGGVLYPPHVFPDEVFNESVFMDICKFADDVWFNAMLLLNKVEIVKSYTRSLSGDDYVSIEAVQYVGLFNANTNVAECRNDVQIKAVWEKYHIDKLM